MPELPEVETIRRVLQKKVSNLTIKDVVLNLPKTIDGDSKQFIHNVKNKTIMQMNRVGKWLIFELNEGIILSHLRMEGRYYFKPTTDPTEKHEHVIFYFENDMSLRYHDTRQFGKMKYFDNLEECLNYLKPKVGPEPFNATIDDLIKLNKKSIAIKTSLLDQTIISGIGNIYADEILFRSKINPMRPANKLTKRDKQNIINNSIEVLNKSIDLGGTTIHSYESEKGITGLFQQELLVHTKKDLPCPNCGTTIIKTKVNGRGTYYCPNCQKK